MPPCSQQLMAIMLACVWDMKAKVCKLCSVELRLTTTLTVYKDAAVTALRLTCYLVYSWGSFALRLSLGMAAIQKGGCQYKHI